jgi:hypothetical protein
MPLIAWNDKRNRLKKVVWFGAIAENRHFLQSKFTQLLGLFGIQFNLVIRLIGD